MNKRIFVFVGLSFLSTMSFSVFAACEMYAKKNVTRNDDPLRKFCSSSIASLALSGCVGATTGSVIRYLEKKFDIEAYPVALFLYLLSWTLESEIRNEVIIGLQGDLDAYQIKYKKGLMFKSAWIASWLAYLQV